MPLLIDSAPDCITHVAGAKPADDSADFILQANYQDCAGFMTFGPGTTWGDGGQAAAGSYYVLIWLGAAVMVLALFAWFYVENRTLVSYAARNALGRGGDDGTPPTAPAA
jgi:hypothetical protein